MLYVFEKERSDKELKMELQLRSFLIDFTGRGVGVGLMQNMDGVGEWGGLIINDRICR